MHSNPKKVLHALKKSLLRIALVHPSVSFKIVDIESEDDLLCTHASPSPLLVLSSEFGIHLSSLNKVNASDGSFKLSGYISGPDVYTMKVLQYFCIHLLLVYFPDKEKRKTNLWFICTGHNKQ
ncbi:DNA mismatch repair protein MLH3-like [Solanum pennellii]|uniref:DNA mismatch repair protein MLH3-like n=1 Tax=Solanum pennellii TaxID=28526 RepID=A0ABM1V439_SOLPN|nr:DNA mismatch repair protein MLH3-like [Solanum pennellii]